MLRPLASLVFLAGLASWVSAAHAGANPFASAGEGGVGVGWQGLPAEEVGSGVRLDGDALRLEARGIDGARVRACQVDATPVQGRVRVHGEWKLQDVVADKGWFGARVRLKFLDAAGNALESRDNTEVVASGRGSRDWERLDAVVDPPAGAAQVRVCVDMFKTTSGTAWFRGLEVPAARQGARNVVWIVIDTLRADALHVYGADEPVSPFIDGLAEGGLMYDKAWSQYTWTNPSTVSAFTSQYARTHGWEYPMGKSHLDEVHVMSSRVTTLAEILRDQGFLTQGWYANGYLKGTIGFSRGFHAWSYAKDDKVVESGIADIRRWDADGAPNFLYLHLMTPHVPLRPSAAGQRAAGVSVQLPADGISYHDPAQTSLSEEAHTALFVDAYRASVYDADAHVGKVLAALKASGHLDDTLVILSSDHGEMLGEHGEVGHGNFVYEPLTSVPLIVSGPGVGARREAERVGQVIDIAPTVLDWLDLEAARPRSWQGLSLLERAPGRTAVSERNQLLAVTTDGRWKAIEANASGKLQEAYDLDADPAETQDLSSAGRAEVAAAQAAGQAWRKATPDLDNDGARLVLESEEKDDTMEMLQQLGYVE